MDSTQRSDVLEELSIAIARPREARCSLIEADGSRGRSLKAPEKHEPVIPAILLTLWCRWPGWVSWVRRLESDAVHRSELVAALTESSGRKSEIGPAELAALLAAEERRA